MKSSWPYSVLNAIAVILLLAGVVGILESVGKEVLEGSGSKVRFWCGLGALIFGIIFLVLADLGSRLVRIEAKLGTLPKDELSDEE